MFLTIQYILSERFFPTMMILNTVLLIFFLMYLELRSSEPGHDENTINRLFTPVILLFLLFVGYAVYMQFSHT